MVDVKWCRTHDDVALVYGDGSVSCRWELVVEAHTDDHVLVELPEVERLRAEVAQLDAICRWNREHVATVVDEEFGLRIGGKACEHPSLTGGRCDACGWTAAWDEEVA